MADGGTSRTDGKKKTENDPVRFRRWIAMTSDSKWREFRGTAGMVDVGRGNDLVDLVDRMMTTRMLLHSELSKGWCVMKRGLTPLNAGWIFSEMIAGIESLHKFEVENFSKKNGWARPKERGELPCYLSDLPVKDGTVSEDDEAVSNFQKHMEMLFGRSLPPDFKDEMFRKVKIAEIATSARERLTRRSSPVVVEESNNARTNATMSATRSSSAEPVSRKPVETPILRSARPNPATTSSTSKSAQQPIVETPILKSGPSTRTEPYRLNPQRVCSGIGIVIDRNNQPRIVMTDNYRPPDARAPPLETTPRNPPLMTTNMKPKEPGAELMTVLVTRNTNGEILSCELAPVSYSDDAPGRTAEVKNYPDESLDFTAQNTKVEQTSTPENWSEIATALVQQKPTPEVSKKRPASDSGLSSTSEAVNLSTGSCTPVTSEKNEKEERSAKNSGESSSKTQIPSHEVGTLVVETVAPKDAPAPPASPEEKKPSVQTPSSYASVVGSKSTSPNVRHSSGAPAAALHVVMEDNPLREEKKREDVVTSRNGERDKRSSNKNNWILVKPKNASDSNDASSSTSSPADWPLPIPAKPCKPEKPNSMMAVAENWDNIVVDEEAERQQELKRLKKQKQRAAKVEKEKEEKRLQKLEAERVENVLVDDTAPVAVPENPIRVVALLPIPMIVLTEHFVEPEKEKEEGSFDPVTGKFSDGHIFHEYEDEGEAGDKKVVKDAMFLVAEEHAKIVFRILWFDNNKKLEKCSIDAHNKQRLQDALDLIRAMHDRIDIAGQMIVYRIGRKMSSMKELNIVSIARNLIDMTRHTHGNDVIMAKSLSNIIVDEKIMKNFIYEKHIHTILTLPTNFIPKLDAGNTNTRTYKEITMLANLFTKRVSKVYEELCGLYEFKIEKDRKRSRRGY